jgi:hypothetical protein
MLGFNELQAIPQADSGFGMIEFGKPERES